MKRILLVALAVCGLLALFAAPAFAQGYGDPVYPVPAVSPHGGFTLASQNCRVCHAVHNANDTGEVLLNGVTVANACTFCHVEPGVVGYIRIYDGVAANYNNASDSAHDVAGLATCVGCHQVHAAENAMVMTNTIDPTTGAAFGVTEPYLVKKILKVSGAFDQDVQAGGPWEWTGSEADGTQVSKWCTQCHPYYNEGYNGNSHVMRGLSGGYAAAAGHASAPAGDISQYASTTCHDCHNQGDVDQAIPGVAVQVQYSFPHYTQGDRFLSAATALDGSTDGPATDSKADGVCMRCHRGGVVGGGVGIDW